MSSMDESERALLLALEALARQERAAAALAEAVERVREKLRQEPESLLSWEPAPLEVYGPGLPSVIRSSWVFGLRAGATTGAERHSNSHQRMLSYKGNGDFQVWTGDRWRSHHLVSDPCVAAECRWISIPPGVWHQAVVGGRDWLVVPFHTAPEDELIEERPDAQDPCLVQQRRYVDP